ncbi:class F sortase [Actinocatenispora comari]|uniref:Class F sortase n=1 Tax=Actinocatenispora comari TaxID=2807577 RepID=A0A8J4ACJ9_9ACTN|nr:class F sortase [Actinocatenispora comari]GIL27919.1 hypothetical protein NUM_31730 [Actinocatenispora comari]
MALRASTGRRLRRVALASAVVLAFGGGSAIALAATEQSRPPRPPAAGTTPAVARSRAGAGPPAAADTTSPAPRSPSVAPTPVSYPASTPTHLGIRKIGVDAPLRQVGRDAHGAIGVPQPGPHYDDPAWYRYSPTPGQIGPAVIVGHIDSASDGPSVFFRLGALRRGDTISVRRADGRRVTFGVDRVAEYPKDRFPTATVYGATRTAQLRLITCGGSFDRQARSYRDNIVVYASLRGDGP